MQKRDPLRLMGCQIAIPSGVCAADRDRHVAAVCERISNYLADTAPVDLIVLPELCTMTYSRAAFEMLDDLAEPLDGPSATRFAELVRAVNAMVVFGFARCTDTGFRISQVMLNGRAKSLPAMTRCIFVSMGPPAKRNSLSAEKELPSSTSRAGRSLP